MALDVLKPFIMAEPEIVDSLGFDPTKKKKKKKKKVLVAMEDEADTQPTVDASSAVTPEAATVAVVAPTVNTLDVPLDDTFLTQLLAGDIDFASLHKRKRKVVDSGDTGTVSIELELKLALASLEHLVGTEVDFSRKKKKKSSKKPLAELDTAGAAADTADEPEGQVYEYTRNNPDMAAGEKKRFTMKPPQVVRLGAKKTGFVNFTDICKLLHRQPEHLLAFLFSELGTSGSVDSSTCLVIKGRFQQKQIESILRRYIREYVTCHTCRSPNTFLAKRNRLYFLQCESCGANCSVTNINSGFQAVTGRRAALRAKAQ